jgi:sugar-specific transcriptional regulator TrmB
VYYLALVELGEKTLREIGLTLSQARVYLALVKLGTHSTVKTVSVFSKVARQDVYRTLTELRELSLVEMVIGNPALFRAIPLQEAVAILMERKNQRTRELLAEASELFKLFAVNEVSRLYQENHQFVLIPKKEALICRIKKVIEGAQESILIISPWRELTQWLFNLHESWEQALKRGVKVQWITEKKEDQRLVTEITRALIKDPNFTLRTESTSSMLRFGIYDGKEVFITVSSTPTATESPALWTNNPAITFIVKDYFETKWQLSAQYNLNKLIA